MALMHELGVKNDFAVKKYVEHVCEIKKIQTTHKIKFVKYKTCGQFILKSIFSRN